MAAVESYVVAIDRSAASERHTTVDGAGRPVATGQKEHHRILPQAGWVEHDAVEIRGSALRRSPGC